MKVTVLAPHPDDEAIGCGGSLLLHGAAGDRVSAIFLSSGELGLKHLPAETARATREKEALRAAAILGIGEVEFLRAPDWMISDELDEVAAKLAPVIERQQPDLLYLPHPHDEHPDHKSVLPLLDKALEATGLAHPELRAYEIWTPLREPDVATDISAVMAKKIRALRAHRSQLGYYDYVQAVRGLNAYRGALMGRCRYAEVFQRL